VVQDDEGEVSARLQKRAKGNQRTLRIRKVLDNGVAKEEVKGLSFGKIGGFFDRSGDEPRRNTRRRLQHLRIFLGAIKHLLNRVEEGHPVAPSGKAQGQFPGSAPDIEDLQGGRFGAP
jgi:hypothetical protein